MNRLFERLTAIYPDIDFLAGDIVLQDDSDGKGAYIKQWNSTLARPTEAQLLAVVLPSEQDIKKRAAIEAAISAIKGRIASLEQSQSRAVREVLLGGPTDRLAALEAQIVAERAELVKALA